MFDHLHNRKPEKKPDPIDHEAIRKYYEAEERKLKAMPDPKRAKKEKEFYRQMLETRFRTMVVPHMVKEMNSTQSSQVCDFNFLDSSVQAIPNLKSTR